MSVWNHNACFLPESEEMEKGEHSAEHAAERLHNSERAKWTSRSTACFSSKRFVPRRRCEKFRLSATHTGVEVQCFASCVLPYELKKQKWRVIMMRIEMHGESLHNDHPESKTVETSSFFLKKKAFFLIRSDKIHMSHLHPLPLKTERAPSFSPPNPPTHTPRSRLRVLASRIRLGWHEMHIKFSARLLLKPPHQNGRHWPELLSSQH